MTLSFGGDAQRLKQNSTLASTLRLFTRVLDGDVNPSTRCTRRGGATTQRGAGQSTRPRAARGGACQT